MAEPLPFGIYDRLMDEDLRARPVVPTGVPAISPCSDDELPRRLIDLLQQEIPDHLDALAHGAEGARRALDLTNRLLALLRASPVAEPPQVLSAVHAPGPAPVLPLTGVARPWLFTAGRGEPSLLGEVRRELETADQADLLISFITSSGVRRLRDVLQAVTAVDAAGRPRLRLRIITTTYTGATDAEAVDLLARLPGCEVKVSLDGSRTRLHAKSWIFQRAAGTGTAYIGSANLSAAALMGGIEWTVKITEQNDAALFARAAAEFACLWADPEFQPYRPEDAQAQASLRAALARERGGSASAEAPILAFDWVPRPFQRAMLERLAHERTCGRTRNLVVAATGTGKTVVAALDYRRVCEAAGGSPPRLLFIAHRREILERALATFRSVLRPLGIGSFGGLLSGRDEPPSWDHLFATIDAVVSRGLLDAPDRWHTVIIDECHRMGPETRFNDVVSTLRPVHLLGLTATPERGDGQSILPYFQARPDGAPAVELRLWDALDQQLVVPFEYYACDDATDFREIRWGAADERADLERVIMLQAAERTREVVAAWRGKVGDPRRCRALAFCVSVAHADYVARALTDAGIPALAVHGQTPAAQRADAPARLARGVADGGVAVLTTVDLYNEGIDIPSIDTLLFLRPTQSPVVFQQQLGRGLRHHEHAGRRKESCLVLDFVGRHRQDFRFDRLLGPLLNLGRRDLERQVEQGFTSLPPGCHLHLEPKTRDQVLMALREGLAHTWRGLRAELQSYAATRQRSSITLASFIRDQALELADLYPDRRDGSGWMALRRAAGLPTPPAGPGETELGRRLGRLLHHEDPGLLHLARRVGEGAVPYDALAEPDRRRLRMLAYQLDHAQEGGAPGFLGRLAQMPALGQELAELSQVLADGSDRIAGSLPGFPDVPLCLHAPYARREILAALGRWTDDDRPLSNTGIERCNEERWEAFFITIDKSSGFHGRVAYHDAALAPDRLQWQTQSGTTPTSAVGRRYLESVTNGWRFLVFIQARKGTPFYALGPVDGLLAHHGTKPMTLVWRLAVPMPQELFQRFSPVR